MSTLGTVSFYTLGCKLNYSETSSIGRQFTDAGYQKIDFGQGADIVVINTCSVTDFADRKCRNIVRLALGENAGAKVKAISRSGNGQAFIIAGSQQGATGSGKGSCG